MRKYLLSSDPNTEGIRRRRLGQFITITIVALLISSAHNVFFGNWRDAILLVSGAVLTLGAYGMAKRGYTQAASATFTLSLLAVLAAIHWLSTGTHDPTLLAYPALMVFTGLLCAPWLFWLEFALIMLNITLLVIAEAQGWRVAKEALPGWPFWIDVTLIMVTVSMSIALIMRDFRHALASLRSENQRVRRSQKEVEFLASHDALTKLPNRLLARDRCEHALALARRAHKQTALLYIDLDNFKTINDSLGHAAGDQLLLTMSERLQTCVRESDTVARQGGDEFLIILECIPAPEIAADIAKQVIQRLAEPLALGPLNITATCSIGVAVAHDQQDDFDSLLQKADMAMYRAKGAGRNAFRIYDDSMNTKATEQLELASKMRVALIKSEFTLHYQPQFDLRSGQIIGAEALVRWRHPELGLVPPGKFIPVAENSGLIVEMGEWIVLEACRQAKCWLDEGLGELVVGINISPIQFRRGDVEQLINHALAQTGLPAHLLELELTESLLLEDSAHLKTILQNLRSLGISFSIDDFGTGYSNLSYLKHFEVERLKIDQSFIRRLSDDAHDEAIVRAIIQVADSLNLHLIAEGIEDTRTLTKLQELGCEQGQGFLWSPAITASEFKRYVQQHQASPSPAA
ncbi:bifunctional diguanylate cyclase/phosphodiesterase [Chitinibacter sp. ZOR0017]|uniref:putative bifunctional diguanylate cyclase/phosphodiesterase n=1 Tax=Chitinibacter sp. ZOR0017 TaxID=1339254 RepID=UPI00068DC796|nr:EAL domain-containing protein [Chitinibacter sp. ZOR0017]